MFWIGVLVGAVFGAAVGGCTVALVSCNRADPPAPKSCSCPESIDELVEALEDIKATSGLPEGCTLYDTSDFIQGGQIDEIIMLIEDCKYR